MKKLFLSFAILFATSTVLVSCGDDDKKDGGDSTPAATPAAKGGNGSQGQPSNSGQQGQQSNGGQQNNQSMGGQQGQSQGQQDNQSMGAQQDNQSKSMGAQQGQVPNAGQPDSPGASAGALSTCDCMKLALQNPDAEKAPPGCEWMETVSDEEVQALMQQAKINCPETVEAMGM